MTGYRIEKDTLGEVKVPETVLYGPQTQRAYENFPVSGIRFPPAFIQALGLIKAAAAEVNRELGLLDPQTAEAIEQAALETAAGTWHDSFPLDVFQTGSGTSMNMNANEVIATRACQTLRKERGTVHPNDHVNKCQSSNDVIPAAIHVSAYLQITTLLFPAFLHLHAALKKKETEFSPIIKTGRTHLMDAMPIRLGQEISGWAYQVAQSKERIESCLPRLARLAIGGTAVGTGINAPLDFGTRMAAALARHTHLPFVEAENHFAAQAVMDTAVELSGHLKTAASSFTKIANDLRWMNSGPIAGLGEIALPALQPGSSIMPGKVNPVMCEVMMMACAQVSGNDVTIGIANQQGNFELNTMLPVIAYNLLQSITVLANASRLLADKAVMGIVVHEKQIAELLSKNPIIATTLTPLIGYDLAAQISKKAYQEGRPLLDVAAEMTSLSRDELSRLLDPTKMTEGGILS
ncbi:MAG: class II fumarate hydratase [Nitrospirota bacterium]